MECTRCRSAFVGADGRCPRCDGTPTAYAAPPPPQQPAPNPYAPPAPPAYGYGNPQYGAPQHGTPQHGTPQHGAQPYAAPQYGGHPGYPGPGVGAAAMRPPARLSGLSTAVTVLIGLVCAFALLRVIADFRLYDALGSIWTTNLDEAESIDDFRRTSIVLIFLGFLAAAPVFLVWFHKARANAEGLAPGRHRHGTGMAVGAWFIPFANWWIPKAMTDDIVAASQGAPRPGGLGVVNGWWACWVISSVLAGFGWPMYANAMDDSNPSLEGARTATMVLIGSNLTLLAAGICAIVMVRTVSTLQDTRLGLRF
ncbi:DUF4328 domain-containing protein [Streptomyces sp. NPDC052225]|uniref:DUF4328 domain-containing protein n=1 Tax=Streptomyces sp. NPDC052225 TaxID=3154949 RepID=UPI00342F4663